MSEVIKAKSHVESQLDGGQKFVYIMQSTSHGCDDTHVHGKNSGRSFRMGREHIVVQGHFVRETLL